MSASETCRSCVFARPLPKEVTDLQQRAQQRVCYGGPPQVVEYTMPVKGGLALASKTMRPNVAVIDPACSMYVDAGVQP